MCRGSQSNKNEKTSEGDDEIRKAHWGKKKHCERRFERIEQDGQKVHQGQKNEKTRKNTTDSGGIQRHQKCGRKKTLIPKVNNDKGETFTSRQGIANVFGEFHSNLYAEDQLGEEVQDPHNLEARMQTDEVKNEIPEFTKD